MIAGVHFRLTLAKKRHIILIGERRKLHEPAPFSRPFRFIERRHENGLLTGAELGVADKRVEGMLVNAHRPELLAIHAAQIGRRRVLKNLGREPGHTDGGHGDPSTAGNRSHRRRHSKPASVSGPGDFVEPILQDFIARVDIHAQPICVIPFVIVKADQVIESDILRVAPFSAEKSVACALKHKSDAAHHLFAGFNG
jgi:hypothetical protein